MLPRLTTFKRQRDANPPERVLLLIVQQDGSGKIESGQMLWDSVKLKANNGEKVLLEMDKFKDRRMPDGLLEQFVKLEKLCGCPGEQAKNVLITESYSVYINKSNDDIIQEETESSESSEDEEEDDDDQ